MKRRLAIVYAVFATVLLVAGFLLVFVFAYPDIRQTVYAMLGMLAGFVFAPIVHELGHVCMGAAVKMDCVYVKCFCFRISLKKGRKRFSFASPFSADETQVVPKEGGNISKRASVYTMGGLLFGGMLLILVFAAAIVCSCLGKTIFFLWGTVPYCGYLFLLNLPPLEYASGKTDTLVWMGIRKGYDAERNMLAAMEIQGRLSEGFSFSEIERELYYDVPQLSEEEPLYAVMLDLRYRYHLERGELAKAAEVLNRIVQAQEYLSEAEAQRIAAELTYMHSLNGDIERAEESSKLSRAFLAGESVTAKRVLATFSVAAGKTEAVGVLLAQAEKALREERIAGVRKFEEILLSRIKSAEMGNT